MMTIKRVNGLTTVQFKLREELKQDIFKLFTNGKYKIVKMELVNGMYMIDAELNKKMQG